MATATYNFVPGATVWVLNENQVEKSIVSQVSIVANVYTIKTTYKMQLVPSFTFVDIDQIQVQHAVVAATAGLNGTFSVAGDHTANLSPGVNFNVDNSSGNNGSYVVQSSTYGVGPNTVITVTGTIPNNAIDGIISYIQDPKVFPNVDSALAAYKPTIV
jgi:hypothetical protein